MMSDRMNSNSDLGAVDSHNNLRIVGRTPNSSRLSKSINSRSMK
jgi:hypothetical protein